jgi:two-component system NtrC family sensor kinase
MPLVFMTKRWQRKIAPLDPQYRPEDEFLSLSHRILHAATLGEPRIDFLREIINMVLEFSDCDAVEIWFKQDHDYLRCHAYSKANTPLIYESTSGNPKLADEILIGNLGGSSLSQLCRDVFNGYFDPSLPYFTNNGSFWTNDGQAPLLIPPEVDSQGPAHQLKIGGDFQSVALIPIVVVGANTGLLQLKSIVPNFFTKDEIPFYEDVARTLGVALLNHSSQAALRERVKEMTCMYGISQLMAKPEISFEEFLQGVVELMPPAWQYSDIACGRIAFDGANYQTASFQIGRDRQETEIIIDDQPRGRITLAYIESRPKIDEGPFLKEERILIDTIATQISVFVERRQAEYERSRLHEQLRHADRLATIGQLAAGVAHELNEPLGNILGFAQLAKKNPEVPRQTSHDLSKIENASLHAREVVRKLMLFARQMPPKKAQVNLNLLVDEGIYFLEARCAKAGIEIVRQLAPNLPLIIADASQLHQVLVNLVVNSIQAMPSGGKLAMKTLAKSDSVMLTVEDTGVGMNEEVLKKIFIPFFTTKEVDQGTGLGLSVVHGIITSHGGSINVKSKPGAGTYFEIELPIKSNQQPEISGTDVTNK